MVILDIAVPLLAGAMMALMIHAALSRRRIHEGGSGASARRAASRSGKLPGDDPERTEELRGSRAQSGPGRLGGPLRSLDISAPGCSDRRAGGERARVRWVRALSVRA